MNSDDNPFAPAGNNSGYGTATVGFGEPAAAPNTGGAEIGAAPSGELIKDTSTAEFQADVIAESRNQPVLVDFWAPWCGPCKQLTPVLEAAVRAAGGTVKLVKMNIDDHPAIPGQMGVQSIPAVIAFANGQPIDAFMGAKPEGEVKAFIDKVVGAAGGGAKEAQKAAIDQALEQAKTAQEAGDLQGAAQIYSMILQTEPENGPAYGGMAAIMVEAGQTEQAKSMIDTAPEAIRDDPALAAVSASLALAEKVAEIGDPAALRARLEANPKDHDARFDLAQIMNAEGDREGAAEALLDIMQADRNWREDGARKELLTFFEAWGPTDAATVAARRRLSSLLFS